MQLEPMIRQLSIADKQIGIVNLEPNWAQREYLATVEEQLLTTGKIRLIVLKARQLGLSTITEALGFVLCFLIPRYQALVVTHEVRASQNLLKMTNLYWETWPFKSLYEARFQSRNDLAWTNGSSFRIDTASKKEVGRSSTIHFLHASEVAFWPEPETTMLGLRQTIPQTPGTGIVLESTANGVGNYFERTWQEAVAGENEYAPLFFPWWKHYEYTASFVGLPVQRLTKVSEEERALQAMGVSDDHLLWRRYALVNLCNGDHLKLAQEYPSTPEEAFLSSGLNVFDYGLLQAAYEPEEGVRGELSRDGNKVWFQPTPNGRLTLFRSPNRKGVGVYMIGGDAIRMAGGQHSLKSDFAVCQVINRHSMEQVAIWRGKPDPGTFAEEMFKLGLFYNSAELVPEVQGTGQLVIGKLLEMNYPRLYQDSRPDRTPGRIVNDKYGWNTNAQSKHFMVSVLQKMLVDRTITIHDLNTFLEMRDFVTREDSSYGPASDDKHDDCVDALAMAVAAHFLAGPVPLAGREDANDVPVNEVPTALPEDPSWMEWE